MSEVERLETAQEILKSWKIENALEPKELLLAGQNLHDFINQHYPGSKVLKEWPIFLRNAQNQIMQGWVDVLLETADGYVIIDHKSYPGTDNEERVKDTLPSSWHIKKRWKSYRQASHRSIAALASKGIDIEDSLLKIGRMNIVAQVIVNPFRKGEYIRPDCSINLPAQYILPVPIEQTQFVNS